MAEAPARHRCSRCRPVPRRLRDAIGLFPNEEKREKLEHIDKAVDTLRQRYGYRSVQRAVVYTDPVLGGINAYDDHNIHPVGYFHTA